MIIYRIEVVAGEELDQRWLQDAFCRAFGDKLQSVRLNGKENIRLILKEELDTEDIKRIIQNIELSRIDDVKEIKKQEEWNKR